MVITLSVFHPASQPEFTDWAASLAESAAATEGCLGTDISTVADGHFEPAVAATFVDSEASDRWIDSTRRAEILRRGLRDGSFPRTEPDTDAVAINAIVSRVLATQSTDDPQVRKQAETTVRDFALRALGAPERR